MTQKLTSKHIILMRRRRLYDTIARMTHKFTKVEGKERHEKLAP